MTARLLPASTQERARLVALSEAPMEPADFVRMINAPLSDAEITEARELYAWFTRRYPTGKERLAYVRRAWRRWTAG